MRAELASSSDLQAEYIALCELLDNRTQLDIPQPDPNLNQRIMAKVYQVVEEQKTHHPGGTKPSNQSFAWLGLGRWRPMLAGVALSCVCIMVFYLGKMSNQPPVEVVLTPIQTVQFSVEDSQRIFKKNVSAHLELSGRLFTQVSNADSLEDIQLRLAMTQDLVAFNRLYRRVAEQSGDKSLTRLLTQMERLLLDLNHSQPNSDDDLMAVQNRLARTDLIYKLKVTNNKIDAGIV